MQLPKNPVIMNLIDGPNFETFKVNLTFDVIKITWTNDKNW